MFGATAQTSGQAATLNKISGQPAALVKISGHHAVLIETSSQLAVLSMDKAVSGYIVQTTLEGLVLIHRLLSTTEDLSTMDFQRIDFRNPY